MQLVLTNRQNIWQSMGLLHGDNKRTKIEVTRYYRIMCVPNFIVFYALAIVSPWLAVSFWSKTKIRSSVARCGENSPHRQNIISRRQFLTFSYVALGKKKFWAIFQAIGQILIVINGQTSKN